MFFSFYVVIVDFINLPYEHWMIYLPNFLISWRNVKKSKNKKKPFEFEG